MRAARERAVAHELALKLESEARGRDAALWAWASRIVEFTKPRPWWRFW